MNYEQKYKEALERAKGELRVCGSQDCDAARQIFRIFPELKDSEEEKIRKAIICGMNALKNNQKKKTFADIPLDDCIAWVEKQGEQLSDKIEPKFKVGDWISNNYTNYKVTAINSKGYVVEDTDGNKINILFENEKFHHLWTIDDAKDGDVLYYHVSATNFFQIAIFKRVASKDELWGQTYRNYVQYGGFGGIENYTLQVALGDNELHHCGATACPATKEQRDLLFAKMKEAGYEWDSEKKELKKIVVKTLDPDKVIEWLKAKVYDDSTYGMAMIDKFKKDFGLWNDKKN